MFVRVINRICQTVQAAFVLVGESRLGESNCLKRRKKVIGLDFLFFGKLRVLLLVHTATRHTFAFPVQDPDSVEQDVVLTFGKFVREIGLQNGVVTLRCDNEAFLVKINRVKEY